MRPTIKPAVAPWAIVIAGTFTLGLRPPPAHAVSVTSVTESSVILLPPYDAPVLTACLVWTRWLTAFCSAIPDDCFPIIPPCF